MRLTPRGNIDTVTGAPGRWAIVCYICEGRSKWEPSILAALDTAHQSGWKKRGINHTRRPVCPACANLIDTSTRSRIEQAFGQRKGKYCRVPAKLLKEDKNAFN